MPGSGPETLRRQPNLASDGSKLSGSPQKKQLTRRDFLKVMFGGALFTGACGFLEAAAKALGTPTSGGQRPSPEGQPLGPTNTPYSTDTPQATAQPTSTATQEQPTATSAPTETPTPIELFIPEVEYPKVIWQTDFSNGEAGHATPYNPIIPGHYEYIDDPTNSGRGKVFMARIDKEIDPDDQSKIRLYPSIDFRNKPLKPPYAVVFDAYLGELSTEELDTWGNPYLSLLSLFDTADKQRGNIRPWHPFALLNILRESPNGNLIPTLSYIDPSDNGYTGQNVQKVPINQGEWVRLSVEVLPSNMRLFVNGILTQEVIGSKETVWAHIGLYSGPFGNNEPVKSAYLLNDNCAFRGITTK